MKIRKCESCGLGFPGSRKRCPHCNHTHSAKGLHILSEDFLAAFELMEGKTYASYSRVSEDFLDVGYAINEFKTKWVGDGENATAEDVPTGIAIYGNGGVHRYSVRSNGIVLFLAYSARYNLAIIDDAEALGFLID